MKKRKTAELKRLARQTLTGHYGTPMAAMVVMELIVMALLVPFAWNITPDSSTRDVLIYDGAVFIIGQISAVFSAGLIRISLSMARGKEYGFKQLFYGFQNHPDHYIIATLLLMILALIPAVPMIVVAVLSLWLRNKVLLGILIAAAGILMIIGEILIVLRYALVYYYVQEQPESRIRDCLKQCGRQMKGQKGRLLYLILSFLGWWVLGMLSLGIGYLWIAPYMTQTMTFFYLDMTGELDMAPEAEQMKGVYVDAVAQ